jgi:hypothetical protein
MDGNEYKDLYRLNNYTKQMVGFRVLEALVPNALSFDNNNDLSISLDNTELLNLAFKKETLFKNLHDWKDSWHYWNELFKGDRSNGIQMTWSIGDIISWINNKIKFFDLRLVTLKTLLNTNNEYNRTTYVLKINATMEAILREYRPKSSLSLAKLASSLDSDRFRSFERIEERNRLKRDFLKNNPDLYDSLQSNHDVFYIFDTMLDLDLTKEEAIAKCKSNR